MNLLQPPKKSSKYFSIIIVHLNIISTQNPMTTKIPPHANINFYLSDIHY